MSNERPTNANEECVGPSSDMAGKASSCNGCPNKQACASGAGKQVDPAVALVAERLAYVKNTLLILSGKGGVGKSSVTSQLAFTLAKKGYSVGVLDVDICGPSQPRLMGVENHEVHRSAGGWSPVYACDEIAVMSIGFMLNKKTDAVIWKGPRKNGMIRQFLCDVEWGELDYLLVDTPPGTSDEHLSIVQYLADHKPAGAIVVTTPQEVALLDVRKEITFCRKVNLPVLGVVENMSGFVCPCCSTKTHIFEGTTGGASSMAKEMQANFLGSIPLDPRLLKSCEGGQSFVRKHPDSQAAQALEKVWEEIVDANPQLLCKPSREVQRDEDAMVL